MGTIMAAVALAGLGRHTIVWYFLLGVLVASGIIALLTLIRIRMKPEDTRLDTLEADLAQNTRILILIAKKLGVSEDEIASAIQNKPAKGKGEGNECKESDIR
jgi:hypothetical protein